MNSTVTKGGWDVLYKLTKKILKQIKQSGTTVEIEQQNRIQKNKLVCMYIYLNMLYVNILYTYINLVLSNLVYLIQCKFRQYLKSFKNKQSTQYIIPIGVQQFECHLLKCANPVLPG